MSPCRDCGQPLAGTDRFCSVCGAAASMEPFLLGAVPSAISPVDAAADTAGRNRLLLAVGAIVVGVLGWSLIGSADPGAGIPTTTTAPFPATFPPSWSPQPGGSTTVPEPDAARPTTTAIVTRVGADPVPGPEPLLSEPVGLSLLIGGTSNLRVLDLDTGVLTRHLVTGQPVDVIDGHLVLVDAGSGLVRAVPLADPTSRSHLLATSLVALEPSHDSAPSAVWLLTADETGDATATGRSGITSTWRLVSITDGATLGETQAPARSFDFGADGPLITSSSAGGVFALDGLDYGQVGDGVPVAVSDSLVLAQTCPAPTDCQLHWIRRGTWDVVDLPLPAGPVDEVNWLSPDGRVISYLSDGLLRFFDVDRDQPLDLNGIRTGAGADPASRVVISPDGRYLVMVTSRIEVYDLDTGVNYRLELNATGEDRLLLVADV